MMLRDSNKRSERITGHTTAPLVVRLIPVFLVAVILALAFRKSHHLADASVYVSDPLHGDTDEATGALGDALVKMPKAQRAGYLLKAVQDTSPGLRYAAVDELVKTDAPNKADVLESLFHDNFAAVRQRALELMPGVDPERGLRLELAALRDNDSWIRESAVMQLNSRANLFTHGTDMRTVPMLLRALDDPDIDVVTLASATLRKVTGQSWRISRLATPETRQATIQRWKQWWESVHSGWAHSMALADVAAINPTRRDLAPRINVTDVDGRSIQLGGSSDHLTLITFWGTWCRECVLEIPALSKLETDYRSRGVDVVGIAIQENMNDSELKRWCKEHGATYDQALGTEEVRSVFGHVNETPISVLIDREGQIRYRWEGSRDYDSFRAEIDLVLGRPRPQT